MTILHIGKYEILKGATGLTTEGRRARLRSQFTLGRVEKLVRVKGYRNKKGTWVPGYTRPGMPAVDLRLPTPPTNRRRVSPLNGVFGDVKQLSTESLVTWEGNHPDLAKKKIPQRAKDIFAKRVADYDLAVGRTVDAIGNASPEEFEEGRMWYRNVHEWSKTLAAEAQVRHEQIMAVIAVLSPAADWDTETDVVPFLTKYANGQVDLKSYKQTEATVAVFRTGKPSWTEHVPAKGKQPAKDVVHGAIAPLDFPPITNGLNMRDLPLVVQSRVLKFMYEEKTGNKKYGSMVYRGYDGVHKAIRILQEHPQTEDDAIALIDAVMKGPKVRSFYNSMAEPEGDDVTADVWMVRIWKDDRNATNDSKVTSTPSLTVDGVDADVGMYPVAADVVREATRKWNEDPDNVDNQITPTQAQAIAWTVFRNNNTAAGKVTMRNRIGQKVTR